MASARQMTPELIGWQQREFHTFTEVIEVAFTAGRDLANFPADQDFKSDSTKIIGMRAYVAQQAGDKSFLSKNDLMPPEMVASAGVELYENNSEKVYRFPLAKLISTENQYVKLFLQGYSSKESKITLGKPVTADCVVLIEITYV